jgi:hypothetical protein
MKNAIFLIAVAATMTLQAEERFLLAADTQVIEVNREGKVTDVLKHPGHTGIYDAWRLPNGGIAYVHRGGLAVFDGLKRLVMQHAASGGERHAEANSCAVWDGGSRFAFVDSAANQICTLDRTGALLGITPLPDLSEDPIHFRYRTIRALPFENAFWVCQYGRKTVLKVGSGDGNILQSMAIDPMLTHTGTVKKAFGIVQSIDGSLLVSTSTGCQLLRLDKDGNKLACWTAQNLGISCRYLLGLQCCQAGGWFVACGDYHLKEPQESSDLLVEINSEFKVVWRLKREQLVDQIEGPVDKSTGIEEMRITNVHHYDSERVEQCLNVRR